MSQTPTPTTVFPPGSSLSGSQRSYCTQWEIDDTHGAELTVMRSEGGYYCAAFYAVTFERTPGGQVVAVVSNPTTYLRWRLEITPRHSAKRLRLINDEVTAGLADHLAATSPADAAVLARAVRSGALGAMNLAAAHLRATFSLGESRCATEAVAGWTCLATTYPSGNPRAHAYYRESENRWEVSAFPDGNLSAPYHEDLDVSDADLSASIEAHYRRTL